MTGNDPRELISPADFGTVVVRVLDVLRLFVESGVVRGDCFGYCSAHVVRLIEGTNGMKIECKSVNVGVNSEQSGVTEM